MTMIDILDAPFPYFVGVEPNPNLENYDLETEVIRVDLDEGIIALPTDMLMQSQMPKLPFKEHKSLK